MAKTFERGDIVYGIDGQQGEYLMAYEDAHLVLPHLRDDSDDWDHEPWPGEPTVWQEVFEKPPVPVVHEEVAAARAELDLLQKAIREAEAQQRELQRGERDRLARLKEQRGLEQLDDFLAGRITHFVYEDDAAIATFEEAMKRTDEWRQRSVRLLGLYGDPSRTVRWQVSEYSDGSGSRKVVIPCSSEEQALAAARDLVAGKWKELRDAGDRAWSLPSVIRRAKELGVEVPADLADRAAAMAKDSAEKGLQCRRKQLADSLAAMRQAEAEARAAGIELAEAPTTTP